MLGLDSDYSMSRDYMAGSWPTFVVIDPEGIIRFHGFDPDRNLAGVRRNLQKILRAAPKDPKQVLEAGVAYPKDILACRTQKRERSPRLAFDRAGNANVVFSSNNGRTNAVHLRRFDAQGRLVEDQQLSLPGIESYAPDCVMDAAGTLWVAWCGRTNRQYDIFVQAHRPGAKPRLEQLTFSDDDAMSPKIAANGGFVAVTYYKWAKMNGISRDRNIFARTFDTAKGNWGPEVEVSPADPKVEDHTDPDVVVDARGRARIVWSYDYHPQLFRKPVNASQPTIFSAQLTTTTTTGAELVGATGTIRNAIDLFPSVALDESGVLWCAWDCSEPHRNIRLARRAASEPAFEMVGSFGKAICSTPELALAKDGLLLLAWSEHAPVGAWQAKVSLVKEGGSLKTVTLSEQSDILFPQAQQNLDGNYWVVYEKSNEFGSTVVLRQLAELKP